MDNWGGQLPREPRPEVDEVDAGHVVQFYADDRLLVAAVSRFVGRGLGAGEAGIVIATPAHLASLADQLTARGLDMVTIQKQGRYIALDAADTLSAIMVDGQPDEARFTEIVGGAVAPAVERDVRIRAFGEMVGLLWAEGKQEAAIRLEQLWNELAERAPLSLLCGYSLADFGGEADGTPFLKICGEHSHLIGAEGRVSLDGPADHLRAATRLHAEARALEQQVATSRTASILGLERQRAEQLQAWLAAIVESSDDAIVGKTLGGIVTSWNAGAERVFGYTAEEMIGSPISRLVPAERQGELPNILDAVRRGNSIDHFETERVRKDGRRIHVSLTVSPIKDPDGRVIGASKIARDVTERKRADAAKDEFLAMLGHELRNPLAAIQSAIAAAHLDGSRRERGLDIARRQALQLRRIVDDLLDIARVTQGKIVLRKERVFLAVLVERAIDGARARIDERGHTLSVSVPPDISDLTVDADAGRIEQVLVNLLTNAAKYTLPGGRIEVVAERAPREIVLRVRDNGIGISAEMLPEVFNLFSQGNRSLDRSEGGLGLGLALVQRLVELHGGCVEARSDGCGKGAEFVVRLPASAGSAPEPRPTDAHEGRKAGPAASKAARVLVVDDNVDAADSLAMLLEILGHTVDVAHDGLAALEVMQRTKPDVVLMDICLPSIDGFEVARRARMLPSGQHTLLVALTGCGRDEDKERSRAAGFDYHLTKPIDVDVLKGLVASFERPARSPGEAQTLH